jgi:hypothetical protein
MSRAIPLLCLAAGVVAASVCLATATNAGATRTGQVCSTFKSGGRTYRSETLGTGWTCASAKTWIVKLIGDRVHVATRSVPLTNGPRGYHCAAHPTSEAGHATAGHCIKGTIAFPQKGFAWFA